jgi:hypothetical protein
MAPTRAWFVAALVLAAGCSFSPGSAESCKIRCGTGGLCPDGMTCSAQGLCAGSDRPNCLPRDGGTPADGPQTMSDGPVTMVDAPVVMDMAPDRAPDVGADAFICSPANCVDDPNPCTQHVCQGNMCVAMNVMGACPNGVCVNGACACGGQGQPCCQGSGPPCQGNLDCQGAGPIRTCGTCGAVGGPCCTSGSTPCAAGGVCNTTTMMCEACGTRGARCCANNMCAASLACVAGTCQCGGAGQPCCPGAGRACEAGCCGGGGVAGICGVDTPVDICSRMNANCGSLTVTDRCNTMRTVTCGACTCPQVCNNANRCAMAPVCTGVLAACACNAQCCTGACAQPGPAGRCCVPNGQVCGGAVGANPRCCSGCCNLLGNCAPGPC